MCSTFQVQKTLDIQSYQELIMQKVDVHFLPATSTYVIAQCYEYHLLIGILSGQSYWSLPTTVTVDYYHCSASVTYK